MPNRLVQACPAFQIYQIRYRANGKGSTRQTGVQVLTEKIGSEAQPDIRPFIA